MRVIMAEMLLAARTLGLEKVPCVELAHMTTARRKAYALTTTSSS